MQKLLPIAPLGPVPVGLSNLVKISQTTAELLPFQDFQYEGSDLGL